MSRPVRVLLVEDDEDDYFLILDWLSEATDPPFLLERVARYDAALEAMRGNQHDVYLLDYRLGERDGLQLLREASAACCKGPVILLTGQGDRGVDLEAMKAGAVDYLPKDQITGPLLERSIRYALERKHTEEALRQAQKMEAVGRLAGGVAHDFNNLLTVITGFSELLLARLTDDDSRRLAEEVRKAGERAAGLTQKLLAFSRKQIVARKVLDLNAVVADLGALLRRVIGEDVELVMDLDPATGRIQADPGQVEQVVVNLAVNARDAMPRGGKLTVQTRPVDLDGGPVWAHFKVRPGRYAWLSVRDTGCGMTDEVKAHLFEPFFTTKGVGKGTGLGLASVFGAVKQNDGYVVADSEPGQGSAFQVYLPSVENTPAPFLDSSRHALEAVPGRGTVLVVEDEEGVRDLVGLVLRQVGYNVLEAAHGAEALRLCEHYRGPIHLVVTDVVMPYMGGRELVDRLTPLHPGMKVLFLSGYTEDAVLRHGVSEAEVAFLQKPFSTGALARKVGEVVGLPELTAPQHAETQGGSHG